MSEKEKGSSSKRKRISCSVKVKKQDADVKPAESKDYNEYRETLYIRLKDGKYQYTDYYGKYIDINI